MSARLHLVRHGQTPSNVAGALDTALPGAPLTFSDGHLMVLVGFDAGGNPVLNDPAAPTDAGVRRSYPRAAFERQWLTHSGGLSYVIAPPGVKLP